MERWRTGTALGVVGALTFVTAACGGHGRSAQALESFHSRPDLTPPVVTVLRRTAAAAPGDVFLAPKQSAVQKGPLIVDQAGHVVWFRPVPAQATDFRVQTYRGRPVLTWWQGPVEAPVRGSGVGHGVVMDTSYRIIARVQSGYGANSSDLHEFQLTPRGTALITVYRIVPADLSAVGGPRHGRVVDGIVQEVDVATGKVLFTWHSVGHVAPAESYSSPSHGDDNAPFDYFHINSIDEEPDGNLLVSARNTHAVYEIDRTTGAVLWRLGGKRSTFELGPGVRFAWQHDARRQADGTITLFDDGASPAVEKESRAIRIRLNTAAHTATLVRADVSPDHVLAGSQGNAQTVAGGNTLVGWGAIPRVTEFTPTGKVAFDASFPDGDDSYRAYKFVWSATPRSRPAIAVTRHKGGTTVYASWNGATAVKAWQVVGGPVPENLRPVGRATPRAGFETAVALSSTEAYVAVEALGAGGKVLATSAAVAPGGLAVG